MKRVVEIVGASRLHFGLYSFGQLHERQFGGAGAMIEQPHVHIRASPADQFQAAGPLASRVELFAKRWTNFQSFAGLPACRIEVLSAPPEHFGLGVGTQLGLAVATALNAWSDLPAPAPSVMALSVERGLRSAVGTYGFLQGGFIAERGKLPQETLAPLDVRLEIPSEWRFVLVAPKSEQGMHGQHEIQAFATLPAVRDEITTQLISLVREAIVPALATADFPAFSQALYRYCRLAGSAFASIQGGPYNGPILTNIVETMHDWGMEGIGQSSWGPTLFCVVDSLSAAESLVERIRKAFSHLDLYLQITPPCNRGVQVLVRE
jgi:beta-RFAP synthase